MFLKNFKELFLCLHFNPACTGKNDKTWRVPSQRKETKTRRSAVKGRASGSVCTSFRQPREICIPVPFQSGWGQPGTALTFSASQGRRNLLPIPSSLQCPTQGILQDLSFLTVSHHKWHMDRVLGWKEARLTPH